MGGDVCRLRFGMHVHLLLHLQWTASMITELRCAGSLTFGDLNPALGSRCARPGTGEEGACRIR
ncbi:hypothetical protein TPA0908_42920 [Micromonospora sp. AKA38]|nr:hypothetical protein TPA0908_42920 [Micromonospora sp. AKA38]